MSKYGRRLSFGYSPAPLAAAPKRAIQLATRAEALGLECIGIQEQPGNAAYQDMWTLLTAIGMATSCVSLFTNSAVLALHPPVLLAKAAASLDLLTNGRVDIALGVGKAGGQLAALNGDPRSEEEVLQAMEEAIQVMRLMWSGGRVVHFKGKIYHLDGVQPGPTPTRSIGIWLDAQDTSALEMVGRLADGWIVDGFPATRRNNLEAMSQRVDDAAHAAGRQPSEIRRICNISATINHKENNSPDHGSVRQWAERLAELAVDIGIDTFVWMENENAEEQLEMFAQEVVPFTRELAELAPGVSPASGLSRAYQGSGASGATPAEEATGDVDMVDESSMESFPASDPPASASFT